MKGYILKISLDISGTDETAEGEYSGIIHKNRESCRSELIRAKKELEHLEHYVLYIEEV